ncbi:MAG: MipA/OmpV family protein [Myxococcota bacterium]
MLLWAWVALLPTGQTAYTSTHVISEERPLYARILTGMAVAPEYEGSDELALLPFVGGRLQYEYRYIQLDGLTARANLLNHPSWELGPTANLLFGRSPSDLEGPVSELEEVDAAIEVGGFVANTWWALLAPGDQLRVSLGGQLDVNGAHDGWQTELFAYYAVALGSDWVVGVEGSFALVSDEFATTYYSVSASESSMSGLIEFSAQGGPQRLGMIGNLSWAVSRAWWLNLVIGARRFIGDSGDSPIVSEEGSAYQPVGLLGLSYNY